MEDATGFGGQGRPLTDAEAVLLVGDDEAQASKLHAFAEKCVGADHEVDFSGCQGGGGLAFLGGGHGTDEQGDTQAGLAQERFQGGLVLVSQKLGGGHEGSLTAVLVGEEGAGRGDDGLAGTDIALEQAAHGGGLAEVGGGFVDGPALGLGELEGKAAREGREVLVWEGKGRFALAAGAEVGQAQVEAEELLEHQAAAGRLQVLPGGGAVDGAIRLLRADELVLRPEGGGEGVFDLVETGGQGGAEKGTQKVL